MSHDHVGITRLVESGFAIDEQVYCYNTVHDKSYFLSIDRLGTEKNYYDEDVERVLLSQNIEKQFSLFYRDYCGTKDLKLMSRILFNNTDLITQYFSFMYFRSKKVLNSYNNESIIGRTLRKLDHSEFLKTQFAVGLNPLQMIGNECRFYPVLNCSKTHFINNSLGFGFMQNPLKKNERAFFIPLNTRVGILVTNAEIVKGKDFLIIEPNGSRKAHLYNCGMCEVEKELGNGFIFGEKKESLNRYIDYWKKT